MNPTEFSLIMNNSHNRYMDRMDQQLLWFNRIAVWVNVIVVIWDIWRVMYMHWWGLLGIFNVLCLVISWRAAKNIKRRIKQRKADREVGNQDFDTLVARIVRNGE